MADACCGRTGSGTENTVVLFVPLRGLIAECAELCTKREGEIVGLLLHSVLLIWSKVEINYFKTDS